MHVRILEFYKNLKVEIEIAELNLILLKDKEKYLSSLVDKSKKKNIQNDIRATQIYINDLKNICHTLGKKVVEMIEPLKIFSFNHPNNNAPVPVKTNVNV